MSKNISNKSGPWDDGLPLRRQQFNNEYLIKVVIFDPHDDDKEIAVKTLDYGEYEDRKFLGRITHWAMEKDYVVETSRVNKK